MLSPRALILRGPGTNCDQETAYAFERAGGHTKCIHVQALAQSPSLLDDFQIFCIPGGFSYGDDIASGRILALELTERLGDTLRRFTRGACSRNLQRFSGAFANGTPRPRL